MCLSIPAKVESIEGEMAQVSVGGAKYKASLQLLEDVSVGDYVLIHTGFAIQKISEEEAHETLKVFQEFDELNKEMDQEEKESGTRLI
ncbi:MAG: HypC/HybG/HupF family hydrogenase formation chaperone [Bacteroidetes bacterium]|nr:HypC/HybG/HupF family hydrogenase formation chaperone [Bacteroidota bacterium]